MALRVASRPPRGTTSARPHSPGDGARDDPGLRDDPGNRRRPHGQPDARREVAGEQRQRRRRAEFRYPGRLRPRFRRRFRRCVPTARTARRIDDRRLSGRLHEHHRDGCRRRRGVATGAVHRLSRRCRHQRRRGERRRGPTPGRVRRGRAHPGGRRSIRRRERRGSFVDRARRGLERRRHRREGIEPA